MLVDWVVIVTCPWRIGAMLHGVPCSWFDRTPPERWIALDEITVMAILGTLFSRARQIIHHATLSRLPSG